jgi:hypothetical protein
MTLFYVVSDTWCGREIVDGETAKEAERIVFQEMRKRNGEESVRLEQFRAWPCDDWPHLMSFGDAFKWIGKKRKAAIAEARK